MIQFFLGRDYKSQRHCQRAGSGERGGRFRGSNGRNGSRLRHSRLRVCLEVQKSRSRRKGEQYSARHVAISEMFRLQRLKIYKCGAQSGIF